MIGAGDRDSHFTINSDDGYISVNSELDRETVNLDYQLVLWCFLLRGKSDTNSFQMLLKNEPTCFVVLL